MKKNTLKLDTVYTQHQEDIRRAVWYGGTCSRCNNNGGKTFFTYEESLFGTGYEYVITRTYLTCDYAGEVYNDMSTNRYASFIEAYRDYMS